MVLFSQSESLSIGLLFAIVIVIVICSFVGELNQNFVIVKTNNSSNNRSYSLAQCFVNNKRCVKIVTTGECMAIFTRCVCLSCKPNGERFDKLFIEKVFPGRFLHVNNGDPRVVKMISTQQTAFSNKRSLNRMGHTEFTCILRKRKTWVYKQRTKFAMTN